MSCHVCHVIDLQTRFEFRCGFWKIRGHPAMQIFGMIFLTVGYYMAGLVYLISTAFGISRIGHEKVALQYNIIRTYGGLEVHDLCFFSAGGALNVMFDAEFLAYNEADSTYLLRVLRLTNSVRWYQFLISGQVNGSCGPIVYNATQPMPHRWSS